MPALQNFVQGNTPTINAPWLNMIDVLATSVFGQAGTNPAARSALCSDLPLEIDNGGTASRTPAGALANLGGTSLAAAVAAIEALGYVSWPVITAEAAVVVVNPGFYYGNIKRYGAGNSVADNSTSIQAADTVMATLGGGDVIFPQGTYAHASTLKPSQGNRWIGQGSQDRWRQQSTNHVTPCICSYTGSGDAVEIIAPASPGFYEGCQVINIQFDGQRATGAANGLHLNAEVANSAIEGLLFDACAFTNFPGYQVYIDGGASGAVFDICFRRCGINDALQNGLDCVHISGGTPSQITFDDCFISPYAAGVWAVNDTAANTSLRFLGGTIAPYNGGAGANGVYAQGSLFIYGTHIEGPLNTQTGTIGVQYTGPDGAFISPSLVTFFGTNIQIGTAGSGSQAVGWVISGMVSEYNVGGGGDVVITNGGSRIGTILSLGRATGSVAVVVNNRGTVDGVWDVTGFYNEDGFFPGNIIAKSIGKGLRVAEGVNAKQGVATLVGGVVVIDTTAVTANSRIFLSIQAKGAGTPGILYISGTSVGVAFTVQSTSGSDTSTFAWEIFEPA